MELRGGRLRRAHLFLALFLIILWVPWSTSSVSAQWASPWVCSSGDPACPANQATQTLAALPSAVYGAATIYDPKLGTQGTIYVIGGASSTFAATDNVYAYDVHSGSWTLVSHLPTARRFAAAALAPDGEIFVFGGSAAAESAPATAGDALNVVEAYNPVKNTWRCSTGDKDPQARCGDATLAALPTAVAESAAVTGPDGLLHVLGGRDNSGNRLATVQAYDPTSNTWHSKPSLSTAVSGAAATVTPDATIYVIGGKDNSGNLSTVVQKFAPLTDTQWRAAPSLSGGRAYAAALTGPDGAVYLVGGVVGGQIKTVPTAEIDLLPLGGTAWTAAGTQLPSARAYLGAALGNNGGIYTIGGFDGTAVSSVVEEYANPETLSVAAPANVQPGQPFHFTVTALHNGSVDSSFTGTVTIVDSNNPGVTVTSYTFGPGDAGRHTFSSITLATLGQQSLIASGSPAGTFDPVAGYATIGVIPSETAPNYGAVPSDHWNCSQDDTSRCRAHAITTFVIPQGAAFAQDPASGAIYEAGGVVGNQVSGQVAEFSPSTNTWTALPELLVPRTNAAAVVLDGTLYVLGGTDANGNYLSDVEYFYEGPGTPSWQPSLSLPTPTSGMAATAAAGSIFVVGGVQQTAGTFTVTDSVSIFTPGHGWSSGPALPTPLSNLAAVSDGRGNVYALGGSDSGGQLSDAVYFLPYAGTSWQTLAPMPVARANFGAARGPDGTIYAAGGLINGSGGTPVTTSNTIDGFDPIQNTWRSETPMPTARMNVGAAVGPDGFLYVLSSDPNLTPNPTEAYALPDYLRPSAAVTSTTVGSTVRVSFTVTTSYGSTDTNYSGTVQGSSSDPHAVIQPPSVTYSPGTATQTFNFTLNTSGDQWVAATDTLDADIRGDVAITVSDATPHFNLSFASTPAVAGEPASLTIVASSTNGKNTSYTGTVRITSSDPLFQPVTVTFTSADQGQVTVPITLRTAPPPGVEQTVTVTDESNPDITGSTRVTVSPLQLTVTTTTDPSSGCGSTPWAQTPLSLRCALTAVTDVDGWTISFNIPSSGSGADPGCSTGVCVITVGTDLPPINGADGTIDGTTEAGASPNTAANGALNAHFTVEINRVSSNGPVVGLLLDGASANSMARNITIKGLAIVTAGGGSGTSAGIVVRGVDATFNTISGDWIQSAPAGSPDGPGTGILIDSGAADTTIGGTVAIARNALSYQTGQQILVQGTASNTSITGNLIGTSINVMSAAPTTGCGYVVQVGPTGSGAANTTVSGNIFGGLPCSSASSLWLGPDAGGTAVNNNLFDVSLAGKELNGSQATGIGIRIEGAGSSVTGNVIGDVATGITIDGASATGNVVDGNSIGEVPANFMDAGNNAAAAPTTIGINVYNGAQEDAIGAGTGNTITNSSDFAVAVGNSSTDAVAVSIRHNSMYNNRYGGIDIFPGGITCGPATSGAPNGDTPCPSITSASATAVSGSACAGCLVDVYVVDDVPQLGQGEGKIWIGSAVAGSGGSWTLTPSNNLIPGSILTATATQTASGSGSCDAATLVCRTSEFGPNVTVSGSIVSNIHAGINYLSVPTQPANPPATAQSLVQSMNASTGNPATAAITLLAVYQQGRFQVYVPNYSSNFVVRPQQGMIVISTQSIQWKPGGTVYTQSQAVSLSPGWNLVAAPFPAEGQSASQIFAAASACTVEEIAYDGGGQYQTFLSPTSQDFYVPATASFWILCNNSGTWTPN